MMKLFRGIVIRSRLRATSAALVLTAVTAGVIRLSTPGSADGSTALAAPAAEMRQPQLSGSRPSREKNENSSDSEARSAVERTAEAAAVIQDMLREFDTLTRDQSLSASTRTERARSILARLRDSLRDQPADAAAAAIVSFLDTRRDESTGLGFKLREGGLLADAPTVRTALLDMLGQFDPGLSVKYAQKIFSNPASADEYALGLRSLGWQNLEGAYTHELRSRLGQMLDNATWLANPTQGFFEAFDIAVHLSGVDEFASMAGVVGLRDGNGNAVQNGTDHAAYLALDRMIGRNPNQLLTALAGDPDMLSWSPIHRAALMAKADVRNADQRAALETYLTTLSSQPEEMEVFAGVFPNRIHSLGNALVTTQSLGAPHDDLIAGDRASLELVNSLRESGRFPALIPAFDQIASRLSGFLADAASPGK